jgi:hypothetical protein
VSYQTVSKAIKSRFDTIGESTHPDVPRYGPNETPDPSIDELWWSLDIDDGDSFQISYSPTIWRRIGLITISTFAPRNEGEKALRGLKETAQGMFEGEPIATTDGLRLVFKGTESVPAGGNDRFFQVNVNHEFFYDDPS